jgi:hypothetical protein
MTAPFDRAATLTKNLKLEKQGLEIGPLARPIVPKKGTGVLYADHLPTDKLRDKYRGHELVSNDHIQGVDIVVGPSGIGDAVGSRRFNYVLASHVIEHIPNPLGWFNDIYGFHGAWGNPLACNTRQTLLFRPATRTHHRNRLDWCMAAENSKANARTASGRTI